METCPELKTRDFCLIAFICRYGKVFRKDKEEFSVSISDPVTEIALRKIRGRTAQGYQVLVFESGAIKPDWSRIDARSHYLLTQMDDTQFRKFMGSMLKTYFTHEDFTGHVKRSFPQYGGKS